MIRPSLMLPVLLLVTSGSACSGFGEGTFSVRFLWPDNQEPTFAAPVWVFGRVEKRPVDPKVPGRVLGTAVPIEYAAGVTLSFDKIRYGDQHVVVVEIREGSDTDSQVLYYGLSNRFSLRSGDNKNVDVFMNLTAAPSTDPNQGGMANGFLQVVTPVIPGAVNNPRVTLRLATDTGVRVLISNLADFPAEWTTDTELAGHEGGWQAGELAGGFSGYQLTDWDLANGIGACPAELTFCERRVHARFVDQMGYASRTVTASVVLDLDPPRALGASLVREPIYPPAANSDVVTFTRKDPFTGETVFATVYVYANEDLATGIGEAPVLDTICANATPLAFELEDVNGRTAVFRGSIPESATNDTCTFAVAWKDLLGNQATGSALSPTLVIDTTPPELAVIQSQVTLVRSPWGNAAQEPLGDPTDFVMPAGPYFSLAPADPLASTNDLPRDTFTINGSETPPFLRVWADQTATVLLGTITPRATDPASPPPDNLTWPRQRLANMDVPIVYVSALDRAGNDSADPANSRWPTKIENVEWVATPNPPGMGVSPHRLDSTGYADPSLRQDAAATKSAAGQGGEGTGAQVVARNAEGVWRARAFSLAKPGLRKGHAMAYDSARGRMVTFGGSDGGALLQDTWEWDGAAWQDVTPTGTKPDARQGHAMAYDSARGRVVLFGGLATPVRFQDTWEWDGTAWQEVTPPGDLPSARDGAAMAYDSARGRVILFGGYDGDFKQDTWEWDGATWQDVTPTGAKPDPRTSHAMAYDSGRDRIVVFGGNAAGSRQDTWEWDGAAWQDVTPAGTKPTARYSHVMTYDVVASRVVLFGGYDTGWQQDTWEWDGAAWQSVVTGTNPVALLGSALAYDSGRDRAVLFGWTAAGSLQVTWERNGSSWQDVTPTTKPSARYRHALAFDTARKRAVLFGGFDGGSFLQDVWEWNGTTWQDRTPAGTKPSARYKHAMAFDVARGRTVLFGGGVGSPLQDTWLWDGTSWQNVTPAGTKPSGRFFHAMAYDSNNRVVLFGGFNNVDGERQDTWEWDGGAWQDVTPVGDKPSARVRHAMAYDHDRGRVVLFGGTETNSSNDPSFFKQDTWEWDGAAWRDVTPAGDKPSARMGHAMTYNGDRKRVVLFGGWDGANQQDTWEWDGRTWEDVTVSGTKPVATEGHAIAYDDARTRLVVFGGFDGVSYQPTTWEWDANPAQQPGVQFLAGATNSIPASASITGLHVRAVCGARRFSTAGAENLGATLVGWRVFGWGTPELASGPAVVAGQWWPVGQNNVGVNATEPFLPPPDQSRIDWVASSPAEAQQYFMVRDQQFAFRCVPNQPSDPSLLEAQVALDYIEVRVRYAAP